MSIKRDLQKCQENITVSHKSAKTEWLTRVMRNIVKQECLTRVSNQRVMSGCPTTKSVCIAFLPEHTCQHSGSFVLS